MITDQDTNTLFFADDRVADVKTAEAYRKIRDFLRNEGVQIRILEGTRDIWVRDFMPIQVSEHKMLKFDYNPSYLDNDKYLNSKTSNEEVASICAKNNITLTLSDIKLDGGNIVKCKDAVILTDRILADNTNYSTSGLLKKLEDLFECEVYIIPSDPEEKIYGHSDGVLAYIDDNKLLVTKYPDSKYIKKVKEVLKYKFEFSDIWMNTDYGKCREEYLWAYINYIRTKDFIVLPGLSENCDCKEDQVVFRQFQKLFPDYDRKNTILQVYALPILKKEGGLHYASWNIKM